MINNENTNTNTNGVTDNNANAPRTSAMGTPVAAKLEEDHQVKPVAAIGELQQTMIHPSGEIENVFSGKPDDVQANAYKGVKQPLQTIVKPDGEIEKVYVGTPDENNKTSLEENKVMKEG